MIKKICHRKIYGLIIIVVFAVLSLLCFLYTSDSIDNKQEYEYYLYTPTMINKIENTYFIVDCWQNRIIYNDHIDDKIENWHTLVDDVQHPHTIASDGKIYVADDSEGWDIRVFRKSLFGDFEEIQNIPLGNRPHCVRYDADTERFYALSSMGGKITVYQNINNELIFLEHKRLM